MSDEHVFLAIDCMIVPRFLQQKVKPKASSTGYLVRRSEIMNKECENEVFQQPHFYFIFWGRVRRESQVTQSEWSLRRGIAPFTSLADNAGTSASIACCLFSCYRAPENSSCYLQAITTKAFIQPERFTSV
jgi:hypothetical protein